MQLLQKTDLTGRKPAQSFPTRRVGLLYGVFSTLPNAGIHADTCILSFMGQMFLSKEHPR